MHWCRPAGPRFYSIRWASTPFNLPRAQYDLRVTAATGAVPAGHASVDPISRPTDVLFSFLFQTNLPSKCYQQYNVGGSRTGPDVTTGSGDQTA